MPFGAKRPAGGLFAVSEKLLTNLPALLLVVGRDETILHASSNIGGPRARRADELVGRRLSDCIDASEHEVMRRLLVAASERPEGEIVGPAPVRYRESEDVTRVLQVWVLNRLGERDIRGLVLLLLPESSYDRLDRILMGIVAGSALEETLGSLAQSLRHPPVGAESYFVIADGDRGVASRVPDLDWVPGPPGPGPWDEVFSSESSKVFHERVDLPPELREAAQRSGHTAVSCYAVQRGADGRADSCLVVWRAVSGPPPVNAQLAIDRAVVVASLAMSHAHAGAAAPDASEKDTLTGLVNRRGYLEALDAKIARGEQPAVLFVDIDGFKHVNESFGHLAGDAVLRVAARRLASVMRPSDEIARVGGDEFAVLCDGEVSTDQLAAIGDRIVSQLGHPLFVGDGTSVDVGACVGIAHGLPARTPSDVVLAHAYRALHDAKARGRGRWAFASPSETQQKQE